MNASFAGSHFDCGLSRGQNLFYNSTHYIVKLLFHCRELGKLTLRIPFCHNHEYQQALDFALLLLPWSGGTIMHGFKTETLDYFSQTMLNQNGHLSYGKPAALNCYFGATI